MFSLSEWRYTCFRVQCSQLFVPASDSYVKGKVGSCFPSSHSRPCVFQQALLSPPSLGAPAAGGRVSHVSSLSGRWKSETRFPLAYNSEHKRWRQELRWKYWKCSLPLALHTRTIPRVPHPAEIGGCVTTTVTRPPIEQMILLINTSLGPII